MCFVQYKYEKHEQKNSGRNSAKTGFQIVLGSAANEN